MELSATTRTELEDVLAELMSTDAATIDLAVCRRRVAYCQRLQSFAAAAEAELLPVLRRLVAEEARLAAARAAREAAKRGDDTTPSGADGGTSEGPTIDEPEITPTAPPQLQPRESARARQLRLLRAKWLTFFPAVASALTAGRITPEHVDALAAVFERTPPVIVAEFEESWLVQSMETYPPEGLTSFLRDEITRITNDGGESEYQRQVKDSWAWIGIDRTSGMYTLKAVLDPHRGPQLRSAIDQRVNQLRGTDDAQGKTYSQLCLQALIDLMVGGVKVVPESVVVVDHQTTQTGWHPNTVCENIDGVPLPVSIALAACATGNVTAAIIDRTGKVIDYGCSSALADKRQRLLQRAMYDGCVHPDCAVPYSRCEIHHVTYRADHGKTIMSNLVPLCFEHHHQLHDHGWTLTMDTERTVRWYEPAGTHAHTVHLRRLDQRHQRNAPVDGKDAPRSGAASDHIWPIRARRGRSTDRPPDDDATADAPTAPATGPPGGELQLFDPHAA